MKNSFCLSGVAAALLLGVGLAHSQGPTNGPSNLPSLPGSQAGKMPAPQPGNGNGNGSEDNGTAPIFGSQAPAPAAPATVDPGVSSWLAYARPGGCCCPTGKNGPICCEFYVRTGVSEPFGAGLLASVMKMGWDVEAGARTLLFNPEQDAAWTADLSISNIHYTTTTGKQGTITNFVVMVPNAAGGTSSFTIPSVPVTPASLNDTTLNLALGREWYVWGTAQCQGEPKVRFGCDFGGRWGSSKLELREVHHLTGTVEGFFTSVHSDVEIPCSCCIIEAGVRIEYGYLFSNILQPANHSDLQSLNFMFTLGTRY
jgi:hypothetical protein